MAEARGRRLSDVDLVSWKAREASLRRHEAAEWLRKTVGLDFPGEPSEEDFKLGLRSGIILCNALNKVQPGAVTKIIEPPSDTAIARSGSLLTAYQYFENIRNFLDAVGCLGIPTFEASDLEQGGKSSRIVSCILALKSYDDWKQSGGKGFWKYNGNSKSPPSDRKSLRRHSDSFVSKSVSAVLENNKVGTSFHRLICKLLADNNLEEIPAIVENMLNKAMVDFRRGQAGNDEQVRISQDNDVPRFEELGETEVTSKDCERVSEKIFDNAESKGLHLEHQDVVEHLKSNIQELKKSLHSTKKYMEMVQMEYEEQVENLGKHLRSLAQSASGYHKVLAENRKLYNQVQDLKGNIRVYCRVRPFLPGQRNCSSIVDQLDDSTITILNPSKSGNSNKAFTFNKVFGPSGSQEEVFADTQLLIRSVLDGYNVCIFAYGQTGSGKTYTMTGPQELAAENMGVNYRALNDLFMISEERRGTISYDISVQMIEIYNEQVRDLLSSGGHTKKLEIRNNSSNGINVPNANLIPVKSPSDVIHLMNLGHKNRAVGSTLMNDRSSRSHSCLTVHVHGRDLISGTVLRGCMHLVDLAGSERVDKTEASGDRLKEAQHINRSLSALGDVIASLAQKQAHVPYRNSKLTQLLQDSLGGQAKTLMFVHINPEQDALGETISTLKFAERVSTIELGAARVNKESGDTKELKQQLAALKAALARKHEGETESDSTFNDDNDSHQPEEMIISPPLSRRVSMDSQDALSDTPPQLPLVKTPDSVKHFRGASKALSLEPSRRRQSMGKDNNNHGFARAQQLEAAAITDNLDKMYISTCDTSPEAAQQLKQHQPSQQARIRKSSSATSIVEQNVQKASPMATRRLSSRIPTPSLGGRSGRLPESGSSVGPARKQGRGK